MTTRIARALLGAALFIAAVPALAGSIERFLLPRTGSATVTDIAATPTHAWAITYMSPGIAKVGLDGTVLDVLPVPVWAERIVVDPVDGGVWYATFHRLGHISSTGEVTQYDLPFPQGLHQNVTAMIFGPDEHLWISRTYGSLLRVSRAGQITELAGYGGTGDLAAGPDGNVWVTYPYDNAIGRITPSGTRTLFSNGQSLAEYPGNIVAGADGNLWFSTGNAVRKISTAGAISGPYPLSVGYLVAGGDGNLWAATGRTISRFDIGLGTVTWQYTIPAAAETITRLSASSTNVWWGSYGHQLGSISYDLNTVTAPFLMRGPEPYNSAQSAAHVWFTAPNENVIGRLETADGSAVLFTLPQANSRPLDIVAGPDAMWFTEETGDRIGRIDGNGVIQEFPVPTPGLKPTAITYGADGNFWFTLFAGDKVARMTTAGAFTEFALPVSGCGPGGIAAGSDGNLYITCQTTNQVLRMSLGGTVTGTFPVDGNEPRAITAAPDGNLWFSTYVAHFRLTPAGVMTKFDGFPSAGGALERAAGPDGALWDANYNSIVRTTLDGVAHRFNFPGTVNSRAISGGPDGKIWFGDSRIQAYYRLTTDEPIAATGAAICYGSGGNVTPQVLATFIDPDKTRSSGHYQARIDWGDGTTSVGSVLAIQKPGEVRVHGWHPYTSFGPRTVRVRLTAQPGAGTIGQTAVAVAELSGVAVTHHRTSFFREGGNSTIDVATGPSCPWTPQTPAPWITFPQGGSGTGNGSFAFTVAPNETGAARSATIYVNGLTVAITQSGERDPASSLYLVDSCRLVDTRYESGPQAADEIVLRSVAGVCGIPAEATAIAANVTVVVPAASGWLSLFPANLPWPGVSTVNYRAGRTRANNVFLKLNGGALEVLNSGPADVHYLIDVTGYFR
ncbi:MAG TPA: BACON domain-containing carbohydrate-binding protein [Thermoanaerobaculia bacterium]|nr:BACON domain-containing carbohydrate-binding protein [Thermoanaerobaculia bacterium]